MGKLFGTDGVRGVANVTPMTAEMVLAIGRATAYVCKKYAKAKRQRIVIGKDTRVSGYMFENALTAGICSMGVDVLLVGPMPTPGIAFITHSMRADAGLVISASHNPYQDNGIKIFSYDGYKLPDSEEKEIEDLITSGKIGDIRPTADKVGKAKRIDDAIGRYIVFCKNTFPDDVNLEGLKIVLDCANGATYKVAPIIFSELGAEVIAINDRPNGTNINDNCGSLYPNGLIKKVLECKADVGLAFDGDGDRLIAIDETGKELTGDHLLAICAKMYKDRGLLEKNLLVTTIMSNLGLLVALKEMDIDHISAKVGDRYVLELMRNKGAIIGGEQSGHMIFLNHHTTGDGILAALQLLAASRLYNKNISELSKMIKLYPQKIINIDVIHQKPPLESISILNNAIKQSEEKLGSKGRILVRYSGTQNMCRIMVEGEDKNLTEDICNKLANVVRETIGA